MGIGFGQWDEDAYGIHDSEYPSSEINVCFTYGIYCKYWKIEPEKGTSFPLIGKCHTNDENECPYKFKPLTKNEL